MAWKNARYVKLYVGKWGGNVVDRADSRLRMGESRSSYWIRVMDEHLKGPPLKPLAKGEHSRRLQAKR